MRMKRTSLLVKHMCSKVGKSLGIVLTVILPVAVLFVLLKITTAIMDFNSTTMTNVDPNIIYRLRRFNLHDFLPKLFVPESQFKESSDYSSLRHHVNKSQKNGNTNHQTNSILGVQDVGRPLAYKHNALDDAPKWTSIISESMATKNQSDVYVKRLLETQNFCLQSKPGRVRRIMVNKDKTIAYCVIPKAGCTFWIGIFRYINNDTHGQVYKSPFHIPRWTIHYGNKSKEYEIKIRQKAPAFLSKAFRFMFVRDPYKRLWASWIDKFLLPDYWFTIGPWILQWSNSSQKSMLKCPVNISFVDFLEFITDDYFYKYPDEINEHWAPYHTFCDPCVFRPYFIGKMETFEDDSDFVLTNTNLSWVKEDYLQGEDEDISAKGNEYSYKSGFSPVNTSHTNTLNTIFKMKNLTMNVNMNLQKRDKHILHEMEMLIQYTFDGVWISYPEIRKCVSKYFLAKRLWTAFQYNGYIEKDFPFKMTSVTSESWKQAIIHAYSHWDNNSTKRHQAQQEQKRNAMESAYRQAPLNVMNKIQNMFLYDFKQFGYDPQPKSLFKRDP